MNIDKFYGGKKKRVMREGERYEAVCVCLTRVLHDLWLLLRSVPGPGGGALQSSTSYIARGRPAVASHVARMGRFTVE